MASCERHRRPISKYCQHMKGRETVGVCGGLIRMEPKRSGSPGLPETYIGEPHRRQKKEVMEGWVVAHTYLNRQKLT